MAGQRSFESYEEEYSYKCYERECSEEKYDEYLESLSEDERDEYERKQFLKMIASMNSFNQLREE